MTVKAPPVEQVPQWTDNSPWSQSLQKSPTFPPMMPYPQSPTPPPPVQPELPELVEEMIRRSATPLPKVPTPGTPTENPPVIQAGVRGITQSTPTALDI